MDDGSTDDTPAVLESFGSRIAVFRQPNQGAAAARNALVRGAEGDLVAFVDADDLWHPRYLEVQRRLFEEHPNAVAFFTGHVSFFGYGSFDWDGTSVDSQLYTELIDPLNFVQRYNATGVFASMSFCCVPREALLRMGSEHFCVSGAEDAYFCNALPLLGRPVAYAPLPLVAYRLISTSLSANQLKVYSALVEVFRLLLDRYDSLGRADLFAAFRLAFASKRRTYAKLLMGAGRTVEARRQFWLSLRDSSSVISRTKSLGLLLLSYSPRGFQPSWPTTTR